MTRELPLFCGQVVPAVLYRIDAEQPAGSEYHVGLAADIVEAVSRGKGEIEIAHVVIDRSAARHPAGEIDAVTLDRLDIALPPGVLVATDDYGVGVLPEEEGHHALLRIHSEKLLSCEIDVGIRVVCIDNSEFFSFHDRSAAQRDIVNLIVISGMIPA